MAYKYSSSNEETPKLDTIAILFYIALLVIGLISIYSATTDVNEGFSFSFKSAWGRQIIWIGGAALIAIVVAFTNISVVEYVGYGIYAFTILLNIAVLIIGKEISGAKSWFGFGGFGIQPGEFAKFGAALALAKFLGTYGIRFKGTRNIAISMGIFLLPMGIILMQNDTGTALVFLSFFLVLYREGLPGWVLLSALWLALLSILTIVFEAKSIPLYWIAGVLLFISAIITYFNRKNRSLIYLMLFITIGSFLYTQAVGAAYSKILKNYQRDRIEIVLGLKEDNRGMGYNLLQSKIAIGAGKVTGRGFMKGTQTKMGFVPEQHTDFIFCTIGEEYGFLGVLVFFTIYFGLLYRLVNLAERQTTTFGRVFGYSLASILFFHISINIGMTIGLVPIIGIPLPFVSFGGSSLWSFSLLLFTFLKIDEKRKI